MHHKLVDLVPIIGLTRQQVLNRREDFGAFREPGRKIWLIGDEVWRVASLIGAGLRKRSKPLIGKELKS